MWHKAFAISPQAVTTALLQRNVLSNRAAGFEKVSAALAVREALRAQVRPRTLILCVPGGTETVAQCVAAGLLVGDCAHKNGGAQLPAGEVMPLLKGDLLLVSQSVSLAKRALEETKLGGATSLAALWDVAPLSRYTSPRLAKPRVYIANPGWVESKLPGKAFAAVVIDSTHPRTLVHLEGILEGPVAEAPLRVVVMPPVGKDALAVCGYPEHADLWFWDPRAVREADELTGSRPCPDRPLPARTLWLCDGDDEACKALEDVYRRLVTALQKSSGRQMPGFRRAWGIYNRLRLLTVPLAQLEQATHGNWAGNLRTRVEALSQVEGYGNPLWELTWPGLCDSIKRAYMLLLKRQEPAKFWVIAGRMEEWLREGEDEVYRILVPSAAEVEILVDMLQTTVDNAREAFAGGHIEVTTFQEDCVLCANGNTAHILLSGPRPSQQRYLDVFPRAEIEEVVYPFEGRAEQAAQSALYDYIENLLKEDARAQFLLRLGLKPAEAPVGTSPARPCLRMLTGAGRQVRLVTNSPSSGALDLDALALTGADDEFEEARAPVGPRTGASTSETVELHLVGGTVLRYPAEHRVDVFFSHTDQLQRHPVKAVRRGWLIVTFVDGRYDALFKRLTEAIEQRLPVRERIALTLWRNAKTKLLERYKGDKAAVHRELMRAGLTSDYNTASDWFREGEDEVLAPQQEADFLVLARATQAFSSDAFSKSVFRSIQKHRGRNRSAGRSLRELLRAIRTGNGYEQALEGARAIDAALVDVFAAVEVLEVQSILSTVPKVAPEISA